MPVTFKQLDTSTETCAYAKMSCYGGRNKMRVALVSTQPLQLHTPTTYCPYRKLDIATEKLLSVKTRWTQNKYLRTDILQ